MQQQMVLPEGGLASFLTSNLDEMDDSRLAFGSQNGINSMRETAERMAKMGRGGDDVIIHAKTRERLIPQEVSDGNPELMSQVDIAIANAGADPSAYIVGSETNSINPYTGQREFFLKKIISGVKKVFKKLAPIIVPAALNFFTGGAFGAMSLVSQGAIAGGITSLVQGGNVKDALKGAVMGGVIGGISGGIQGFMKPEGGGFKGAVEGIKGSFKAGDQFILGEKAGDLTDRGGSKEFGFTNKSNVAVPETVSTDPTMMEKYGGKLKNTFYNEPVAAVGPDVQAAVNTLNATGKPFEMADAIALANQSATAAVPGSIKYIPAIAAGSALAYAGGAFDEIPAAELDDPYDGPSASERRLANFPRRYSTDIPVAGMGANMDDIMVPYSGAQMAQPLVQVAQPLEEQYPDLYKQYLAQMQPQFAAAGGQMESFPRRTGYIAGPGTETSDDIPAMLSDGEFVMNAKAVRGAGNGSREQGVRNMYSMMRAFEGGAVA
jgi:hypothetical protein